MATLAAAGVAQAAPAPASYRLAARGLHRSRGHAVAVHDRGAGGGRALSLGRGSTVSGSIVLAHPALGVSVRARAGHCARHVFLSLGIDRARPRLVAISSSRFREHRVLVWIGPGRHLIALSVRAASGRCRDAARVDRLAFAAAPPPPAPGSNPFASIPVYVSGGSAGRQARAWRALRPADAGQMDKLAAQPQAIWFADWNGTVRGDVSDLVGRAAGAGRLPVLVAYNLPHRDCGGYSSGGAPSAAAYRHWIRDFAVGVGDRRAAVILEPDGLAELDCLSAQDRATYLSLLTDAIGVLSAHPGIAVYVDAGNAAWQPAAEIARRLGEVGAQRARGFALNVSNFQTTASSIAYGKQISERLGGLRFVIDTSRNGNGPAPGETWCNPPGRALGAAPTAHTDDPAADAYLWIKAPGESDGACNGGPDAGSWWPEYALGLAQRAAY